MTKEDLRNQVNGYIMALHINFCAQQNILIHEYFEAVQEIIMKMEGLSKQINLDLMKLHYNNPGGDI